MSGPFFGKYRGVAVSAEDPSRLGRVMVQVPSVLGPTGMAWAMPCVPYAGPRVGVFAPPPPGAKVWVEFEGGDPEYPIWTGCFWGVGELPASMPFTTTKGVYTLAGKVELRDIPGAGELTVQLGLPGQPTAATVTLKPDGIALRYGTSQIQLGIAALDAQQGAASLHLDPAGAVLKLGDSALSVGPEAVELACAPGKAVVGRANVALTHGAASVELMTATVALNKKALEVI